MKIDFEISAHDGMVEGHHPNGKQYTIYQYPGYCKATYYGNDIYEGTLLDCILECNRHADIIIVEENAKKNYL